MKALLFSVVLLGFVLSSAADSYKFIRSENKTCSERPMKVVFYLMDCSEEIWGTASNLRIFKESQLSELALSFQKEAELNTNGATATSVRDRPRGAQYGICVGHDGSYVSHGDFFPWGTTIFPAVADPMPAYAQGIARVSQLLTSFVAGFGSAVPPYEAIVVMFRWMRHNAHDYAAPLAMLKGAGVRVVTVDFDFGAEVSRQEAIGTGSASEPATETVFTYPSHYDVHYGALAQAMRRDIGHTCVVSSRTQVVTFDGNAYRHDGIGDFVLYRQYPVASSKLPSSFCPQSLEIQVRKSQCDSVLKRMACITGVGMRLAWVHGSFPHTGADPIDISFQYDRTHNDVAIQFMGKLIPSDTISEQTAGHASVERIEPELGLRVTVRLPWFEYAIVPAPVLIADFFVDEGKDPVIVVYGGYGSWITSTGMCGTHDSCAMNDFVRPDGLFTVDRAPFADEWRVEAAASIFEWTQFSNTADPTAFALRQPLYSASWSSQAKKKEVGDEGLSDEATYLLCAEACQRGYSGVGWINAQGIEEVCGDLCDLDIAAFDGLRGFDLHGNFSEYVPKLGIAAMNGGQRASVRIPIEGTYVFGVQTGDCCKLTEPANVTVEVKCERDFTVDAGDDISVVLRPFPMPYVRLDGSLKGSKSDDVHFSWKIIEWPNMPESETDEEAVWAPPQLMYPNCLTPYFQPLSVGNYVLQLVAFDGCHRVEDTVQVAVQCFDMAFAMDSVGQQIIWQSPPTVSEFHPVTLRYFAKCPAAGLVSSPSLETNFSLVQKAHEKFVIRPDTPQQWSVFAEFNMSASLLHYNITTTKQPDDVETSVGTWTTLPERDGFVRVEGQRLFYYHDTDISLTKEDNATLEARVHIPECTLTTSAATDLNEVTQTIKATRRTWGVNRPPVLPQWLNGSAIQTDIEDIFALSPFGFGVCSAIYGVSERIMSDSLCKEMNDSFDLPVHCGADWTGPLSKPINPCFVNKFDYEIGDFRELTVFSDSSDRTSRGPLFPRWAVTESPNNTVTGSDTWVFSWGPTSATLTSMIEGKFSLRHEITNGCGYDSEDFTAEFACTGDVTVNMTCPPTALTWNYSDAAPGSVQIPFDAVPHTSALLPSGSRASASVTRWFVTAPDGTTAQVGSSTGVTHLVRSVTQIRNLVNRGLIKSFTMTARVTDNCRHTTGSCAMSVVCPNSLTLRPDVVNKSFVYTHPSITSSGVSYTTSVTYLETSWGNPYPITSRTWQISRNQTVLVSGVTVSSGTSTIYSAPGEHIATLTVRDGCQEVSTNVSFMVTCPPNILNPYITLSQARVRLDNASQTVMGDPSGSTIAAFRPGTLSSLRALWALTDPQGTVVTSTRYFTAVNQLTPYWFIVEMPGTYFLNLTFTDGCKSQSESVSVVVDCLATAKPAVAPVTPVTWKNNKFPIITLDGSSSQWTHRRPTYYWYVLEAPKGSLFEGRLNSFAQVLTDVNVDNYTEYDNTVWWTATKHNVTKYTRTYTRTTFYETRLKSRDEDQATFGACFRPDLPGDYTLELQMSTLCKTEKKTLTVSAKCNEKPEVVFTPPTTAVVWERLLLDASHTTDKDGDDLSFEWSVVICTPDDPTMNSTANDLLLNRHSSKAFFIPGKTGKYCMSLLVSDGCTPVWQNFTIDVGCGETMPEIEEQTIKVKFDGLDLQKVDMEVPINEDLDPAWHDSHYYAWTLVSFDSKPPSTPKHTDGEIAGIVVGTLAGAAAIAAMVAIIIVVIIKGGGGAASGGAKASAEMGSPAS